MRILNLLLPFALLAACHPAPVVTVGNRALSPDLYVRRARQQAMLSPGLATMPTALERVVRGFLAAEILERMGRPLDRRLMQDQIESLRKTGESAPLEAFYAHEKDFVEVGYLPDFAMTQIAKAYEDDPVSKLKPAQAARRMAAEAFKRPGDMAALAAANGSRHEIMHVTPEGFRFDWENGPEAMFSRSERRVVAGQALAMVEGIAPGTVFLEPWRSQEGYLVVRFVKRTAIGIDLELIPVEPPSFESWFWTHASGIKVMFGSKAARELIGQSAWFSRLSVRER